MIKERERDWRSFCFQSVMSRSKTAFVLLLCCVLAGVISAQDTKETLVPQFSRSPTPEGWTLKLVQGKAAVVFSSLSHLRLFQKAILTVYRPSHHETRSAHALHNPPQ